MIPSINIYDDRILEELEEKYLFWEREGVRPIIAYIRFNLKITIFNTY